MNSEIAERILRLLAYRRDQEGNNEDSDEEEKKLDASDS
jgi:hypothetical protein